MDDRSNVVDQSLSGPTFAASIRSIAEKDAVAVVAFLAVRGLFPQTNDTILSVEMLLGISLCLRLRGWELNNIRVHIEAGLPTSDEVFDRITSIVQVAKLNKFVKTNWVKAIRVYHESFLWSAVDCDLAVDIAIVADQDEQFLDAVADFLLNSQKG